MRNTKGAFTLLELLIAVTIISIMMVFLYESYAQLNQTNNIYKDETNIIKSNQLKKKLLFLDFSLILDNEVNIINQDKHYDVVFFQSSNSIHKRYNPYIAYIAKKDKLYRLESLKPFKEYPLSSSSVFDVDYFGEIDEFRVYKAKKTQSIDFSTKSDNNSSDNNATDSNSTTAKSMTPDSFLVHVGFKKEDDILYKILPFN